MKRLVTLTLIFCAAILAYTYIPVLSKANNDGYVVKRVIDGDTLLLKKDGKEIRVRLIGVDTPESVHKDKKRNTKWGKKASKYTKSHLTGKVVYLESDTEPLDRYGRTLAYVYTDKNKKTMFNKELVKNGYARAVYYAPNGKYRTEFESLQKKAKKEKKGFWKTGYNSAFPR